MMNSINNLISYAEDPYIPFKDIKFPKITSNIKVIFEECRPNEEIPDLKKLVQDIRYKKITNADFTGATKDIFVYGAVAMLADLIAIGTLPTSLSDIVPKYVVPPLLFVATMSDVIIPLCKKAVPTIKDLFIGSNATTINNFKEYFSNDNCAMMEDQIMAEIEELQEQPQELPLIKSKYEKALLCIKQARSYIR